MILTPEEISAYREKVADSKRLSHAAMFCGTEDVERLLDEVEASRAKIEQLAEKISMFRESAKEGH